MAYIRHKFLDINIIAHDLVEQFKERKVFKGLVHLAFKKKLKIMICKAPCIIVIILKNYESVFPKQKIK